MIFYMERLRLAEEFSELKWTEPNLKLFLNLHQKPDIMLVPAFCMKTNFFLVRQLLEAIIVKELYLILKESHYQLMNYKLPISFCIPIQQIHISKSKDFLSQA